MEDEPVESIYQWNSCQDDNTPNGSSTYTQPTSLSLWNDLGHAENHDKVMLTNGSSTRVQSSNCSPLQKCEAFSLVKTNDQGPLDTDKQFEEIPTSSSPLSAEFCTEFNPTEDRKKLTWKMLDLTESVDDRGIKIIKDFVAKHPLEHDEESDRDSFQQGKTKAKEHMPTKKKALKDISNKKTCNDNVVPSKEIPRANVVSKRAIKIPARYKEAIDNQISKPRKRNVSPSNQKVASPFQVKQLKQLTKEAVALKLMGEHNIDFMYKRLDGFVKNLQRPTPKESFDFSECGENQDTLDILMSWAFTCNKVKLTKGKDLDIGQDEVELL